MLHRFEDATTGSHGHSAEGLASCLALLRRHGYRLVSVADLFRELREGIRPRPGTVAFSVDDGYRDFFRVGASVFQRYDCPVTVFLVTGVIDDRGWFWWDTVEYLLGQTACSQMTLPLGNEVVRCEWKNGRERAGVAVTLLNALKRVKEHDRLSALAQLPALLRVHLPDRPPNRFASMTWDEVRQCAAAGVTFGPHTVTSPILSRTTDEQAEFEIQESWNRVRAETSACVPVFCYPQGDSWSFSVRERTFARRAGLVGALSAVPGYATVLEFNRDDGAYTLPRFGYPDDRFSFVQVVTGVERVKARVRRMFGA